MVVVKTIHAGFFTQANTGKTVMTLFLELWTINTIVLLMFRYQR